MILRRLTKHVDDQNWFAVFLDMLVVVVGIFAGLQLSDLNEGRKNNIKGQNYLARIAVELEQDIEFIDYSLKVNKESIENGFFLLQTLEDKNIALKNPTKFIKTIERFGVTLRINVSNNTFEELKYSGELQLIRNEELRNKISNYYDFFEFQDSWSHIRINAENIYFTRNVGILKPHQVGSFINNDTIAFSEEEALDAYEKFKQNHSLIEWIPTVLATKKSSIMFDTNAQRRAKELLSAINASNT